MKAILLAVFVAGFAVSPFPLDDVSSKDQEGIENAALDYMEGALSGDAVRVERAVHSELTKVTFMKLPKTETVVLRKAGSSRLIELVRAGAVTTEPAEWNVKVTIQDAREGLASVVVTSSKFYDCLQIAKIGDQWKIINVLWEPMSEVKEPAEGDEAHVRKAALDYIDGAYSGDASRMERAIHGELTKIFPLVLPKTNKPMLNRSGAGLLIEATRANMMSLEESQRNIEVTVLGMTERLASVMVLSRMYYDYLQLAKLDGQWKIVNVLWKPNPDAPKPTDR
jgi:hypothetical protein